MAEEIEIKPMDSERLARFRQFIDFPGGSFTRSEVAELLAAHDFFRKRADVRASDVETAGVTSTAPYSGAARTSEGIAIRINGLAADGHGFAFDILEEMAAL